MDVQPGAIDGQAVLGSDIGNVRWIQYRQRLHDSRGSRLILFASILVAILLLLSRSQEYSICATHTRCDAVLP